MTVLRLCTDYQERPRCSALLLFVSWYWMHDRFRLLRIVILKGSVMAHLWETEHPYYGSSYINDRYASFEELREFVELLDDDLNVVYRWDWYVYDTDSDEQTAEGGHNEQTFKVHIIMPRVDKIFSLSCPITKEQENEVRQWLQGPRVLGYLRRIWAPILDEVTIDTND